MEKITTVVDERLTKELLHGKTICGFIYGLISLTIIAFYFVMSIIGNKWTDSLLIVALVIGCVALIADIVFILMLFKSINKTRDLKRTIISEFLDEAIIFEIFNEKEKIQNGKISYSNILGYKETKNYLFLRLKSNQYFGINKVEGLLDFVKAKGIKKLGLFNIRL